MIANRDENWLAGLVRDGWLLARGFRNKMLAAGGLLVNAGCRNARVKVSSALQSGAAGHRLVRHCAAMQSKILLFDQLFCLVDTVLILIIVSIFVHFCILFILYKCAEYCLCFVNVLFAVIIGPHF